LTRSIILTRSLPPCSIKKKCAQSRLISLGAADPFYQEAKTKKLITENQLATGTPVSFFKPTIATRVVPEYDIVPIELANVIGRQRIFRGERKLYFIFILSHALNNNPRAVAKDEQSPSGLVYSPELVVDEFGLTSEKVSERSGGGLRKTSIRASDRSEQQAKAKRAASESEASSKRSELVTTSVRVQKNNTSHY